MTGKEFEAACFGACVAFGVMGALVACTARETAKDAYTVQSKACVVAFDGNPAKQHECVEYVRARWSQLGAPPAAVGDAGHE